MFALVFSSVRLLCVYYDKAPDEVNVFFTCLRYGIVTIFGRMASQTDFDYEGTFFAFFAAACMVTHFSPRLELQSMRLKFTCRPDGPRDCGGN